MQLIKQETNLQKTCGVQEERSQTRLDLAQISEDCLNPAAKLDQAIKGSSARGQLQKDGRQAEQGSILLPGLTVEKGWERLQKTSERDRGFLCGFSKK